MTTDGFGPEGDLIGAASALAHAIAIAIEEAHACPERRCALPSLIGPVLEQVAALISAAVGPVQICSGNVDVASAQRQYPETLRVAEALFLARKACCDQRLSWVDLKAKVRDGLTEIAVSQVTSTSPALFISAVVGEA